MSKGGPGQGIRQVFGRRVRPAGLRKGGTRHTKGRKHTVSCRVREESSESDRGLAPEDAATQSKGSRWRSSRLMTIAVEILGSDAAAGPKAAMEKGSGRSA
jgi:hypothetical protein